MVSSSAIHHDHHEIVPVLNTAYTTELKPATSYEYKASVQTEDYNNYQSVKSVDPAAISLTAYEPVVIKSKPIVSSDVILTKTEEHPSQILVKSENIKDEHLVHSIPSVITSYNVQPSIAVHSVKSVPTVAIHSTPITTVHTSPIVHSTNYALPPVIKSVVKTKEPVVKSIVKPIVLKEQHIIVPAEPIVQRLETPIVEVDQEVHTVAVEPVLTTKSQYHSQDELGRASYGHSEPTQSHVAYQDENGGKTGSFSYVSPNGHLVTTNYVADHHGYRAKTNAFPQKIEKVTLLRHKRSAAIVSPFLRESTLTQITHNPGHAVSYRIDDNQPEELVTKSITNSYIAQPAFYTTHGVIASPSVLTYSHSPIVYNTVLPTHRHATITNVNNICK